MKLCRFNDNRLGVVEGDTVFDVSAALDALPPVRWPYPLGDALCANLNALRPRIESEKKAAPRFHLGDLRLQSPVANPSKIIGAPVNYKKHLDEAQADKNINFGTDIKSIDYYGLFLKANSSLVGPGEGVAVHFPERRTDHECELAVIIGSPGKNIAREKARDHVAAYAIGLDITVRGTEDRSFRKSVDSYSVLGPWMVTKDEIADPNRLDLELTVNGLTRQKSNTRFLIYDVEALIAYASTFYTLLPGDIIMTGTPEGVGPLAPGDTVVATVQGIGAMTLSVR